MFYEKMMESCSRLNNLVNEKDSLEDSLSIITRDINILQSQIERQIDLALTTIKQEDPDWDRYDHREIYEAWIAVGLSSGKKTHKHHISWEELDGTVIGTHIKNCWCVKRVSSP